MASGSVLSVCASAGGSPSQGAKSDCVKLEDIVKLFEGYVVCVRYSDRRQVSLRKWLKMKKDQGIM